AQLDKCVVKQGCRAIEVRVADAQAAVCHSQVRSPVALRTPQRLAEQRDEKAPVHLADTGREKPAKLGVSDQPGEQAVDRSLEGRTPTDRLVDGLADRLDGGRVRNRHGGHSCLLVEVGTSTIPADLPPDLSNRYSILSARSMRA